MTNPDQAELSRRARNLVEFLRRLTQMKTVPVRDVGEYEEVVWFASVPDMAGSHCVTHDGQASDADWIAIERPRIPLRPQAPAVLWDWLVDDADSTAEPAVRGLDEGEELPDGVVAAYDQHLDAWREWTAKYGPRVPLLALYERLFRIKQQADQLGERFETVVAAGLALVPGGERGGIRRHLMTMRAEVHYEPQTGRITVRPAPDGIDVQFEDDMLDPTLVPHKELRESAHAALVAAGTEIWSGTTLIDALTTWTQAMRHDAVFDAGIDVPAMPSEGVLVTLAPALILRKRTTRSLLAFYRKVDEQLEAGTLDPGLVAGLVAEPNGPSSTAAGTAPLSRVGRAVLPEAVQRRAARRPPPADDLRWGGGGRPARHREVAHDRQPRLSPPSNRPARACHKPHEPRARGPAGQAAR